jgi:hypothetical protein
MDYEIRVTQVGPQPTAVVRRQAKQNELIKVIPPACSEVWDFFRTSLLPRPGRNVVLYLDEVINLEVGVEVALPFTGNDQIIGSCLPGGLVATTTHFGEYVRLHEAHAAIHRWCAAFNHVRTGPNWEVYGHWEDDPVKRRTDVYYLLQADGTTP